MKEEQHWRSTEGVVGVARGSKQEQQGRRSSDSKYEYTISRGKI